MFKNNTFEFKESKTKNPGYHTFYFDLDEKLKRKLISSLGKMESISKIVDSEYTSLKEDLRMLILTDYIKKESLTKVGTNDSIDNVSVVSIFEVLRRKDNIKIAVLSGSLVILPNIVIEDIKNKYDFSSKVLENTEYSVVSFKGTNKDKVRIVSNLFENGSFNILIGTKSLLGEGWDSPCINSLILAVEFVTTPFPNCHIGLFPRPGKPADQTSIPSVTDFAEKDINKIENLLFKGLILKIKHCIITLPFHKLLLY